MKKILFLTPTLPYPPVSGGVIKSYKVTHFLSDKYELSVACILKNDDPNHIDAFLKSIKIAKLISHELNVPRTPKNFLLSNLQGIPLNLFRNKSAEFKKMVEDVIHDYDAVFCDHYVMFQYIPKNYKGRIILHEHNCEYLIWQRFALIEQKTLKKWGLLNQSYRIKKYEQQICDQSHVILAAPNDTEELVKIGADRSKFLETYHLGDDHMLHEPVLNFGETETSLLYIGTLSWEANVDGLIWFYNDIWPLITKQHPDIKLFIVGKNPDDRLKAIAARDNRITLTGFVEDVEPLLKKNRVFITPLRFGSGIKVKVVNALYRGIPCVTTTIGSEGLKVKDGEHIFVRNDPQRFADAVHLLLTDKETWNGIRTNSRKIAFENYTWENVLKNVERAIEG